VHLTFGIASEFYRKDFYRLEAGLHDGVDRLHWNIVSREDSIMTHRALYALKHSWPYHGCSFSRGALGVSANTAMQAANSAEAKRVYRLT
jgi:hypothetical protein